MLLEPSGVRSAAFKGACVRMLYIFPVYLFTQAFSGFESMARYVTVVCLLVCQLPVLRHPTTVLQLTPAVFTPRTSVLPRHISSFFPLTQILRLYLRILHIFGVCNLLAHRSLINFLASLLHPRQRLLALLPSNMHDFIDNGTWANQMDASFAFSMLPNPDEGFGGAEAA
jgi:hypothetical protein